MMYVIRCSSGVCQIVFDSHPPWIHMEYGIRVTLTTSTSASTTSGSIHNRSN